MHRNYVNRRRAGAQLGRWPKKLTRRLGALIALLALGVAAHGQTLPEPRTVKINERVYVLLGPIQHANRLNQGYMINSTVMVGDKGVILIDSGGTDEVGRHIATAVRQITDKPVAHVVNTHHHGDHSLGNVAFEGATFISSEMCRKMVLETGHEWLGIMERDIGRKLPGTRPLAAEGHLPCGHQDGDAHPRRATGILGSPRIAHDR